MANNSLAPIAKWSVEHEEIVALHIGRWSNEDIAKKMGKTPVRISQILSDPKARELINAAGLRIRTLMMENLEEGLAVLAVKGMARIAETLNIEFVPGTDAKKHQDRLALDLIKLVKGDENQVGDAPPLDADMSKRLIEALEDATAADRLIEEAQFEIVEEDE